MASKMTIVLNEYLSDTLSTAAEPYKLHKDGIYFREVVQFWIALNVQVFTLLCPPHVRFTSSYKSL